MMMGRQKNDLEAYRAKRDFSKTPEPEGHHGARAAAVGPRFVIHKHAARRLHYDLRLELDGVFKSWAVTKGPSLDPKEKRLAIHVEDHPLDYGDFEGIIPKGEYGGGTVMIWDEGVWLPEGDAARGLDKGHLTFRLEGKKLRGGFHLVRLKSRQGERQESWLLIKANDEFARSADEGDILEELPNSAASGRTMEEIAADDPEVWHANGGDADGAGASTALPMPEFVAPCLAELNAAAPKGDDWLYEIKFDGYRLIALIAGGQVKLMSRNGLDWTERFSGIAAGLGRLKVQNAIVDGEAVIEDANGVSDFSALQAALSDGRAASEAVFFAFDLLQLDGKDLREAPLEERKQRLEKLLGGLNHPLVKYSEHYIGDGAAFIAEACRAGLEGVIAKRRSAAYRSGRGRSWLKIKCTNLEAFVIGGFVPSTAMKRAVGSLCLGYYEGGKLVYVGRTGTGFSASMARELYTLLQAKAVSESPFVARLDAAEARGVTFVEPELVAEVEFRGWTADGKLRHAAFKGLREDKPARDVRAEEKPELAPPRQKTVAAASKRPAVRRGRDEIEFEGVRLTHPDRILWEGMGLTKLGLAEYYAEVAHLLLPHIAARPIALVRCPSGSEGTCFFQKHRFQGLSEAVRTVRVPSSGGEEEALVIDDLQGLLSLVQASALEIHPWGASIADLERPDRLVFDLDPGEGVGWGEVVQGANEIKERLNSAGIRAYVKTSGGKGLHVVANLKPQAGWDEVKDFAHHIARQMERDQPNRYISRMTKGARTGKIFVDYLRNGRGATSVAAYSTRARPGAPISAPVAWRELSATLSADRFTVGNISRRLAKLKDDPWTGFFEEPQRLPRT